MIGGSAVANPIARGAGVSLRLLPVLSLCLLTGCAARGRTLGIPPAGAPSTVAAARAAGPGVPVLLRGRMVER